MAELITTEEIRNMSEAEWQAYRNNLWNKKRDYYQQEMPSTYLKSQESFAAFLERRQGRFNKK